MNLLDTLMKGGIVMIPIALCSITAIAVSIERWIRLRESKILPGEFISDLKDMLRKRRLTDAIEYCEGHRGIAPSILKSGLYHAGASRDLIRDNLENAGRQANLELTRGLGVLATISSISTLLGLMGTVMGMIRVFQVISIQGVGDPSALSGGISEALITTAAGLAVGIPTLVLYNYFQKRADVLNLRLEKAALEVLDILDTTRPLDTGNNT